jgi:diazepam-binding inhibitor (GABA receptor modulating acyl-CoA-binding protein)
MNDLKKKFDAAAADSKNLSEATDNDVRLRLYGLFKQVGAGDVSGSRPGFTDIVGRAKYDAWAAVKGAGTEDAMRQYIDLVESLKSSSRTTKTNDAPKFVNRAETTDAEVARVVTPQRRAFLDAALMSHLGPEVGGDVPGIAESYARGGHLNFNGLLYDTLETLTSFHRNFGFDGQGMISRLGADLVHIHYTFDAVIVEYAMRGTVAVELGGAPAGRPVTFNSCVVYCFDEAGKLRSERIYLDTGNLLPAPIFRP